MLLQSTLHLIGGPLLLQLGWMEAEAALVVLAWKACACCSSANSICWWQRIRLSVERTLIQLGHRCSCRQSEINGEILM